MTFSSRNTRAALLAYALLAVLILGGVTWGTIATLKLERERVARDTIDAALERIDRYLMPVIVREVVREYSEYNACRVPTRVHSLEADSEPGALVEVSPLYNANLAQWIQLHFQVSPDDRWQSPQIPQDCFWPPYLPAPDESAMSMRREVLHGLRATCVSYDLLASRVTLANELRAQYEALATGDWRGDRWAQAQRAQLPPEVCEPARRALRNLGQQSIDPGDERPVGVTPSTMTPVWLDCADHQSHQLAFIRSADMEGTKYYQGFLVDWEMLKEELLAQIADLLPEADLEPVEDAALASRNRPILLPNATVIAGSSSTASVPWTSTHLLLIVAWTAALAILGSVGVGIRSLLALAERRTQFAYAVTHELRTPLTTLRLYTDMLASGLVKKDDLNTYFQTLSTEAERLSDMVNGVLEYARVENRAVKLDLTSLTVSDLLESIRERCATRCDNAGKRLVVDANGLGPSSITTDPQLVRQVVANLVDNACKHTRGAQDPAIIVRAVAQHGDRIALDVEDRGPGISFADRQLIFRPFRRGRDSATRTSGGIGLGLALARSWSRLLEGHLELVTDHGRHTGTCFRLTIPRHHK